MKSTYVIYSKKVDKGSVAWHSMCLYSSTSLRVHFSTIVVVCNREGSARKLQEVAISDFNQIKYKNINKTITYACTSNQKFQVQFKLKAYRSSGM